jgi:hypothetical protein
MKCLLLSPAAFRGFSDDLPAKNSILIKFLAKLLAIFLKRQPFFISKTLMIGIRYIRR